VRLLLGLADQSVPVRHPLPFVFDREVYRIFTCDYPENIIFFGLRASHEVLAGFILLVGALLPLSFSSLIFVSQRSLCVSFVRHQSACRDRILLIFSSLIVAPVFVYRFVALFFAFRVSHSTPPFVGVTV